MDVLIPAPWRQLPLFVGDPVLIVGSADELQGRMTGRMTFEDGTQGCYVELTDSDAVVAVPLADVRRDVPPPAPPVDLAHDDDERCPGSGGVHAWDVEGRHLRCRFCSAREAL